MLMNGIDWAVIAGFFVVLAAIPTLASFKAKKTAADFFTSSRTMPWWLIGFSMVAATTATDSANFFTEVIRRDGMSGNWVMWAFVLTGLLTVFVYAKLWVKSGVSTDIEFYELRYSGGPAVFLRAFRTLYLGVVFNVLVLGNVILAAVKLGVVLFGVEPSTIYAVTVAASVVYTFFGGIRGVIWTDFFLFLVIMASRRCPAHSPCPKSAASPASSRIRRRRGAFRSSPISATGMRSSPPSSFRWPCSGGTSGRRGRSRAAADTSSSA